MADPELNPTDSPPTDTKPQARSGRLVGAALTIACVLVVVLVECAIAMFLFPSAEDTREMALAMQAESKPAPIVGSAQMDIEEEQDEGAEKKEVELGDFEVSAYQPLSSTTLRINVHLFGLVSGDDVDTVMDLLDERQARVREQVTVILRAAELTDLTDPVLGLIKRKILEKTNRILGKPYLEQIVLSDFSFLEQ